MKQPDNPMTLREFLKKKRVLGLFKEMLLQYPFNFLFTHTDKPELFLKENRFNPTAIQSFAFRKDCDMWCDISGEWKTYITQGIIANTTYARKG